MTGPAGAGQSALPWPVELKFRAATAELVLAFDDGFTGSIPYELLRVESPSAETKGHGGDRPPPPAHKKSVTVKNAETVGRYAVRIRFSDGHDTGLYSWSLLRELAERRDAKMSAYVAEMKRLGLSRE